MTPTPPIALTPCEQLAQLQAQMALLISGQAVRSVDTPQLGRVEFSQGSINNLQMEIERLTALCAQSLGLTDGTTIRRRPINIEAWP